MDPILYVYIYIYVHSCFGDPPRALCKATLGPRSYGWSSVATPTRRPGTWSRLPTGSLFVIIKIMVPFGVLSIIGESLRGTNNIYGWLSKLGPPLGVLSIIRHLVFRGPKGDHDFDNHPCELLPKGHGSYVGTVVGPWI